MATRENQGLQIALIIFLMITVGLAISTYYFFRQAEEQTKLAIDYDAKAKAADSRQKSMYYQLESLKLMVGASKLSQQGIDALKPATPDDGTKEIDRIKADFNSDMAAFDGSVPAESRNWRALPSFLMASLMKRNNDLLVAVDSEKKTVADKDVAVAAEDNKVKAAMAGLDKAKADVLAVNATFTTEIANANKLKTDLEQAVDKATKETGTQTAVLIKQLADEKAKVSNLNNDIRGKAARLKELTNESFERPHGHITWVNMRTNTCYIDLGRADGLQRQVTFSVYDPGVNTLEIPNAADERKKETKTGTKRKGSIEVTEILDEHLAECRILEDDIKNPLLPGDQIFTPAWRPGQRMQFALVGRMNIDNDREDDRLKIKNLIESNGGDIVAEVLDNGDKIGALTSNTRFLVIGERPADASDDKQRAAFNDIIGAAERNGVQQISARDLVAMMGYKGTDRTVTLGTTGAADVEKKPENKQFRPRPRPAAADAGAF
jgi:hypothetical protein